MDDYMRNFYMNPISDIKTQYMLPAPGPTQPAGPPLPDQATVDAAAACRVTIRQPRSSGMATPSRSASAGTPAMRRGGSWRLSTA